MVGQSDIRVTLSKSPHAELPSEICEHKGVGHPDTICDGVAEAVSRALCAAYLQTYGEIRHHNVDKALLIGGQSKPKFGGGEITAKVRLIVAGRAASLPGKDDVSEVVCTAAKKYLTTTLRCPIDMFAIESAVRTTSPNLDRVMPAPGKLPLANDTSFGVGFAPYSSLEQSVLDTASLVCSSLFRQEFPVAGDDFKVMGVRFDEQVNLTIALAVTDRHVESCSDYFSMKDAMSAWLLDRLGCPATLRLNALDDPASKDESGIYLTVSGLSAEHGDDGQVGRGNRVSRLITPSRPMSLEAAAGKCPVTHVGKIYNVLADQIARELVSRAPCVLEANVQIVSCIGQPINLPQLVEVEVVRKDMLLGMQTTRRIEEMTNQYFSQLNKLTEQLVHGKVHLF
ncbi:methionine adenosyltransferase [Noviherbaspirillum pedocola]|uniref:Methionine adenosyltransferase n=1 Tax=Noviherbaspirillum pedocola TaxID=2801341 RepID=A0A934ST03_9BURK|nr:methionine adenosyltransferase [Noviherbaspirillum pedocola]MBK4734646.1 methionine adenosyltransferase [Noviherbaspirillum pedocola]